MSILNAKSSNLAIFPISINRNSSSQFAYELNDDGKEFLDENSSSTDYEIIFKCNIMSRNEKLTQHNFNDLIKSYNWIEQYYDSIEPSEVASNNQYYNGTILSEHNISTLIEALTIHNKGFVVDSYLGTEPSATKYISFVLNGRYFKLTDTDLLQEKNLYVGVYHNYKNTEYEQIPLYDYPATIAEGQDDYDIVKNVDFSETDLTTVTDNPYSIVLCLIKNGVIPTESKFAFTSSQIQNIDGGTV